MKKLLLYLGTFLALFAAPLALSSPVAYAACPDQNTAKGQVYEGIGETGSDCSSSGVDRFIATVVKIISYIAGIVAIIAILFSGFKYMTSGGDSNKIASAKNTLIYALVGVIVAVLAQVLVNVVFTVADEAATPPKKKSSSILTQINIT